MLGGRKKDSDDLAQDDPRGPEDVGPRDTPAPRPAPQPHTGGGTFIDKGSEFDGKLTFDGTVRIDGKVTGEIFSKGTLVIGPGAMIDATIQVDTCQISGEVHGNVLAKQKLELKKPGKLYGDIRTPTLVLEAGVIFEGNCKMENVEQQPRPAQKPEPPKPTVSPASPEPGPKN